MCGLAGIIRKTNVTFKKEALEDLIYVTQLRGVHSVGMIYSYLDKSHIKGTQEHMIGHAKEAVLPSHWVKTNHTVGEQQRKIDNKVMAFHCRWATKGKVDKDNAHPFKEDHILLMHNGTLRNDYALNNKYFPVDSQAVAHYLAQPGNTTQSFVHDAEGAYALVWMDYNQGGTLNFLRNDDRTLFFAESKDFIVWASEAAFLNFINDRHNLGLGEPIAFPSFVHRKFDVVNGRFVDVEMEKPAPKKHVPITYGGWYGRDDDLDDFYNSSAANTNTRGNVVLFPSTTVPDYSVADNDKYFEYFAKLIAYANYDYKRTAPGYIAVNSKLPSNIEMGFAAWDFITNNNEAFQLVYDVTFEEEEHIAVSVLNQRIIRQNGDFIQVECILPIQWSEASCFTNVTVTLAKEEYNKAKRNKLLVKAEILEVDYKTGTLAMRGGVALPCFDPCIEGSVTEKQALAELNDAVQDAKAGITK